MNDPKIALKKIDSLLTSWSQNQDLEAAYYSSIKILLSDISSFCSRHEITGYAEEKLSTANWHIDAMFGADVDNNHDFSTHLSGALGCISVLSRESALNSINC